MGRLIKGKEAFNMPPVRVLLVDGDKKYQLELARELRKCGYEVTKCNRGKNALARLRKDRNRFDVMMTEIKLPDMDGFKLLQKVVKEMDLPVIVISSDNHSKAMKNALINGAYYYLVKPISKDILDLVWQNLFRENISKPAELQQPTNDVPKEKKKRVEWTLELRTKFTESEAELKKEGFQKPTPKMIWNRMERKGVKGLTVENVKSHKQKRDKNLQQDMQGYNGPSPVHVESMNLATQLGQAPAAMNISSHHIGDPDCRSSQFPFVTSSGAIEDTCGYQSNNVMTQIMTQTPLGGKICNELPGRPVFDNGTSITASTNLLAKNPENQDLDKIAHFRSDNYLIHCTSEPFKKFDSDSWDWSNSGDNNFKTFNNTLTSFSGNFANSVEIPNNTFLTSVSGNITNSVEIPSTSLIDKEDTCGYQSNNFMTQIMTQIPSSGQICNELPGGQAFDYEIDAPTNLLLNPQNQAFQFDNDPANCPFPELSNFDSLHWGNSGDHNLPMSNNTFHPSSSGDCGLVDIANIPYGSIIAGNVASDIVVLEFDWFSENNSVGR